MSEVNSVKKGSVKSKKTPEKEWENFPVDSYLKSIEEMVHQNFKTVNTNADAGGIRLGRHQAYRMPYVSLRSLMSAKGSSSLVLDRTVAARYAPIFKQISEVSVGTHESTYFNINTSDVELIKKHLKEALLVDKKVSVPDMISPRMRQIHVPLDEGGYISITPISSGAVANHIKSAIDFHKDLYFNVDHGKENREIMNQIQMAEIPIGGANPVNIGDTVFSMRTIISKEAPSSYSSLKSILSIHNKGLLDLYIPKEIASKYINWRNSINGSIGQNFTVRAEHSDHIKKIVLYFLRSGQDAFDKLSENRDRLTHKTLLSPDIRGISRGLIDKSERNSDWNYAFSRFVLSRIIKLESDDNRIHEYSNGEIQAILTRVRSLLN